MACIQNIDSIHLASRVEFIFSGGNPGMGSRLFMYGSLRAAAILGYVAARGALPALPDHHGGEHGRRAPDLPKRGR